MVDYPGNAIPAAGFHRGPVVPDDELLYSTHRFTQKGVTLAAGQGVLLLGTVLARRDSDKLYVKYASGGTGGTGTAVGILRKTVDTGSDAGGQKYLANIVISGILKLQKVSAANNGTSAVVSAFGGSRVSDVLKTFTF